MFTNSYGYACKSAFITPWYRFRYTGDGRAEDEICGGKRDSLDAVTMVEIVNEER
jgi:hypothetical protein